MQILVTGGTGTAGTAVVTEALQRGHGVTVLSRKAMLEAADGVRAVQGSVTDAKAVHEALDGIDAVIDCTNVTTLSRRKASDFFSAGVRSAVRAGSTRGLRHYVLLSIVGVDAFPLGYYQAKLAQEAGALGDVGAAASGAFHRADHAVPRLRGSGALPARGSGLSRSCPGCTCSRSTSARSRPTS